MIHLVSNVGFDRDATHTGMAHDLRELIRRGGIIHYRNGWSVEEAQE
jgi:hypothetical protein